VYLIPNVFSSTLLAVDDLVDKSALKSYLPDALSSWAENVMVLIKFGFFN